MASSSFCSHSGVNARTPKGLALLSFIVGLLALVSQTLHALTRTFGFITFLVKRLLEVIEHHLEFLDINHTQLGHMLLELFLLEINLVF